MRKLRTFVLLALFLGFLFSTTACVVLLKKDNGKHSGWNNKDSEKSKGKHHK